MGQEIDGSRDNRVNTAADTLARAIKIIEDAYPPEFLRLYRYWTETRTRYIADRQVKVSAVLRERAKSRRKQGSSHKSKRNKD